MLGLVALAVAAAFAGAAIYISVAEHPARLALAPGAALAQWKPAYRRGFAMQASLAVVAGLSALATWMGEGDWRWLAGGVLMLANWPFTLVAIMPTNRALLALGPAANDGEIRAGLARWGRLHAVRGALGAAATLLFLWALV